MAGSAPFSWSEIDWQKNLRDAAIAIGCAAAVAAIDYFLAQMTALKERGLIDVSLMMVFVAAAAWLRRFVTDSRTPRLLLLAVLLLAPGIALAGETAVLIDDSKPGSYLLTVGADGLIAVNPIRVVRPGPSPTPVPSPTPPTNPPPNPTVSARAQQLTATALVEGGSHSTAASLSAVYSVVADQVEAGTLPLASVAPALKLLSDNMIPGGEAAIWARWRIGIGDLVTTRIGTKADAVSTLRSIAEGTKGAVNGSVAATSGKAIDWAALLQLLLPILLKLLEKFLQPAM